LGAQPTFWYDEMSVIGQPLPITVVQQPEETQLAFRLNQRITAEILQVASDHVALSIQGVRVVAKLTSPDQYAALADYHTARFVVRDLSNKTLTLQLLNQNGQPANPISPNTPELVSNLLKMAELPVNATTTRIARALFNNNIPITPENVEELYKALVNWQLTSYPESKPAQLASQTGLANTQLEAEALAAQLATDDAATQPQQTTTGQTTGLQAGNEAQAQRLNDLKAALQNSGQILWGEYEAQTAASLKAGGLPLTGGTLALALTDTPQLEKEITRLHTQLQSLLTQPKLSPRMMELVKNALNVLSNLETKWDAPPSTIQENLKQAVSILGRSVEADIAKLNERGITTLSASQPEQNLLGLAQLRQELAQVDPRHPLVQDIDRFLDSMRAIQFSNTEPSVIPAKGQWLSLDLPLQVSLPANLQTNQQRTELHTARLRIDYPSDGKTRKIDPSYTSIVIELELDPGEILEVNLSMVHRQIGARITASTKQLRDLADIEIPGLQEGLEKLGYVVQSAVCEVGGNTDEAKTNNTAGISLAQTSINMAI
jgi:hypothetical protein